MTGNVLGNGAICLNDSTDIDVKDNYTARVKVYRTLEITSEAGAAAAEITVPVNDFVEIDDIEGYTILPGGRKIELKSRDIQVASISQILEFGGYRVVLISLRSPVVGSTIHYQYTLKIKSLLYLPRISRKDKYEVRRFAVRVRWQKEIALSYDFAGLESELYHREAKFWKDNLREIPIEPNLCPDELYLLLSAGKFKYGGESYSSATWPDVGRFYLSRSSQTGQSPAEIGDLAARLVAGSRSRSDSVEGLFHFVADSVAYVSLELGKSDFDPHQSDLIVRRRFGDCKDQSQLLSSLYRAVGIDAYPALVATGDYPDISELHPWPSVFDHVTVAIKEPDRDIILDPSESDSRGGYLPARLRGKYYLIADGESTLRRLPKEPQPSISISWAFDFKSYRTGEPEVSFEVNYINEAAESFLDLYGDKSPEEISGLIESSLGESGWHAMSVEILSIILNPDTLTIAGSFNIMTEEMGLSAGISLGSPIVEYLLLNIFNGARSGNYCQPRSYNLEEMISIDRGLGFSQDAQDFDDVWIRDHFEFSDELSRDSANSVYRRVFYFGGGIVAPEDYNSFRDYLLSIKNQRYIYTEN